MDETAPITPGRVLNVWRLYAGLSAAELAEALGVQPSAVSMWENDKRAIRANLNPTEDPTASDDNNPSAAEKARRPVTIGRVAVALGLDADHATAMKGMWLATNSPKVLPARPKWFHNFREPAGPVWVWLRGNPPTVTSMCYWRSGRLTGACHWRPRRADFLCTRRPACRTRP